MTPPELFKLQKLLQDAGLESRRKIRLWIREGAFQVNRVTITDPNHLVEPDKDSISFRDKKIYLKKISRKSYFILNKPYGVVSTLQDPQKRPSIKDYINRIKERVYPVGRLDFHSEGLILLTNDGELTNFIISPRNRIPKTYVLKIKGHLSAEKKIKLLTHGAVVDGIRVNPIHIQTIKRTSKNNSWIRVKIVEGKKHILRKLFKYSGHPVEKLRRTAIGSLQLKKLPAGHWRELSAAEISYFKKKYGFEKSKPTV